MYIQYTMDPLCLPMDLEEDIPPNHLVRVVNAAVNRLDDAIFDAAYPGGGRDSYHPKMLTKVIIYAYTQRIYSSRQIRVQNWGQMLLQLSVFFRERIGQCLR
ncbi:hypothetical protein A3844_03925 [Paenibacillus helianthi]|uniref:Transposase InsH N-terminal domain-containing protein n=1 Tax=Paenibacillus helianthi TaxID=1349432 RepID=A0ABX3EWZ9_9BACL|nr:transposase [Paenibacillus helianthi]OKP91006.1 hypothetical protein A3844_03925 [Paenibacillus helianthi]